MEIRRISDRDRLYPEWLKSVYKPPSELFLRGEIGPDLGRAVAVVGTRRMSEYGRMCVASLVPVLTRLGRTVVSGLAYGIDAAAHAAALDSGGKTAAVIGSGVDDDSIYPRGNLALARRIVSSDGCVVSEYPPGTLPAKHHFPERNRIIAGLSSAVLVIEAPEKSGAMITARLALESGRDVWAVPGPIDRPNSWGPNRLIKQGATPICGPADIYEALGEEPPDAGPSAVLSSEEKAIFEALQDGPLTADEIARKLGQDTAEIGANLTRLEIGGAVIRLGGSRYALYTSQLSDGRTEKA